MIYKNFKWLAKAEAETDTETQNTVNCPTELVPLTYIFSL